MSDARIYEQEASTKCTTIGYFGNMSRPNENMGIFSILKYCTQGMVLISKAHLNCISFIACSEEPTNWSMSLSIPPFVGNLGWLFILVSLY